MTVDPNVAQQANKGLPPLNSGLTPASNVLAGAIPYNSASVAPWWKDAQGNNRYATDVTSAKNSLFAQPQAVKDVYNNIMNKNFTKWTNDDLLKLYSDSVANTFIGFSMTGQPFTPDVYAAELARERATNGLNGSGKAISGSGGVSSSVQKSVRLTDPSTARGLIDQALGNFLGRAADPQEQKAFLKALNVQEKQNPTITRQTTSTSGKSSSSTSSTVGGFNPSTFASEYAAGQEGAGEFKAATSLLDTFIGALGAKI